MMPAEWKRTSTVRAGGLVEVVVAELPPGELVEVSVRRTNGMPTDPQATAGERPIGLLSGSVRITHDFDHALDEFEPYT